MVYKKLQQMQKSFLQLDQLTGKILLAKISELSEKKANCILSVEPFVMRD
jgi:hypothetical protein